MVFYIDNKSPPIGMSSTFSASHLLWKGCVDYLAHLLEHKKHLNKCFLDHKWKINFMQIQ